MKIIILLQFISINCIKGYCVEELDTNETTEQIALIESLFEDLRTLKFSTDDDNYKETEKSALDSEELISAFDQNRKVVIKYRDISDVAVTEISITENMSSEEITNDEEVTKQIVEESERESNPNRIENSSFTEEPLTEIIEEENSDQSSFTKESSLQLEVWNTASDAENEKLANHSQASAEKQLDSDYKKIVSNIYETDRNSDSKHSDIEKELDGTSFDGITTKGEFKVSGPNILLDVTEKTMTSPAADEGAKLTTNSIPNLNLNKHNNYLFGLDSKSKSLEPSQQTAFTPATVPLKSEPFLAEQSSQQISNLPKPHSEYTSFKEKQESVPFSLNLTQLQSDKDVIRFQNPQHTFTEENLRISNANYKQPLIKINKIDSEKYFQNNIKHVEQEKFNRDQPLMHMKKVSPDFKTFHRYGNFRNEKSIQHFKNNLKLNHSVSPLENLETSNDGQKSYFNEAFEYKNHKYVAQDFKPVPRQGNAEKIALQNETLNILHQEDIDKLLASRRHPQILSNPWFKHIENWNTNSTSTPRLSRLFQKLSEATKNPHTITRENEPSPN